MKKEQIVETLVKFFGEGATKGEIQETMEEFTNSVIEKIAKDPLDITPIKPIVDKIFSLCPKCNFIPLAYDFNDYSNLKTEKDFDEITDFITEIISENTDYIVPFEDDDMKVSEVKEMWKLWEDAVKKCYIPVGTDIDACDCIESTYYSVYGYDRKTEKITYLSEINS